MKKIFLVLVLFLFSFVSAEPLRAGVVEEYIPKGFFGSWGVISKLKESNNPTAFNFESRDIWMLSGYHNILILENLESGARSEIEVENKSKDVLKFVRTKTVQKNNQKVVYKETVCFKLEGNNFFGTDEFVVEKYGIGGALDKRNRALYEVSGVKISGEAPS